MDFLNKAFAQLKDLFSSMSPGARITAGLLMAVVVVSLVYLFRGGVSGPDEYLLGGQTFTASDVNAMEGAFAKAGLNGYVVEGNRVRIPRDQKSAYVAALIDGGALPADFSSYFNNATKSASPFESRQSRESRLRIAKQQELSLMIRMMRGIEQAQVVYDEQMKGGFPREMQRTATVGVRPSGGEPLDDARIRSIKNLVASAFAGLRQQDISVTDLSTGLAFGGGGDDMMLASENPYAMMKREYEKAWKSKLQASLSYVPGATIDINVELNPELQRTEDGMTFDPKPVALNTIEESEISSSVSAGPAGRPGVVAQTAANEPTSINRSGGSESQLEKTRAKQQAVTSQDTFRTRKAGLVPNRVTAAIGIPKSYYLSIWQRENPTPEGAPPKTPDVAALAKIEDDVKSNVKNVVVALLPPRPPGNDPYEQVEVVSYTDLPAPLEAGPGVADQALSWLALNWSTIGMTLVGLFCLLMLRSMVRSSSSSPSDSPAGMSPPLGVVSPDDDEDDDEDEEGERAGRRRFSTGGVGLKEELAEMVREDPDTAASILRSWIGEAS